MQRRRRRNVGVALWRRHVAANESWRHQYSGNGGKHRGGIEISMKAAYGENNGVISGVSAAAGRRNEGVIGENGGQ
jgi:hypothetical protein